VELEMASAQEPEGVSVESTALAGAYQNSVVAL